MPAPSTQLASVTLSPEELLQLDAKHPGALKTIQNIRAKTSKALGPQTHEAPTEPVNEYASLVAEHAELIAQGKTSLEIARWLSDKLNFTWPEHHGEFGTCSTPQGDLTNLQGFLTELGVSWSRANGGSDNHPAFYLGQGYFFNALFGAKNMEKADERNAQFDRDWKAMGTDFTAKEQYLKDKVGLDIKGDWTKLTGLRLGNGGFGSSDALYASGALDGDGVRRMGVNKFDSYVDLNFVSYARLCFLA